jgi:hypothetical protein
LHDKEPEIDILVLAVTIAKKDVCLECHFAVKHARIMSGSGKGESSKHLTDKQKAALSISGTSTPTSFRSDNSRTPLTMDLPDLLGQAPPTDTPSEHPGTPQESEEDNTTYFLLDIQTPDNEEAEEDHRSTTSSSSSSSESAQIVIDSGFVRPTYEHHGQTEDGR